VSNTENTITVDRVQPGEKWEFDSEVAVCFDDMLERSIPQHEVMRDLVTKCAIRYATPESWIVDLGTSGGRAIAEIYNCRGERYRYLGCEVSKPMVEEARRRFAGVPSVEIREADVRTEFPTESPVSVYLSVLCLMFVPIDYRQQIVEAVHQGLQPGGAFILIEKILGCSAEIDRSMIEVYHELKREHGYRYEDIDRKSKSLEGVLVPVTAAWNEQLLRQSGFTKIDCFWRWMNFAGWIAVKSGGHEKYG